jgi:hypothetical protein
LNDDKFHIYDEDDTTTTTTTTNNYNNSNNNERTLIIEDEDEEESLCSFEAIMNDPENTRISKYQNTYFMDGGNRFISVSFSFYIPTHHFTNTLLLSYLLWVTRVQKQLHTFLECLKIGFSKSYAIKRMMNDYLFWKILLNY